MRLLHWLTAGLILSSTACWAADNEAYIDQLGEYATIYVEQDGSANSLGGVDGPIWYSNPAMMYGDGQNVDIRQVGSGNYLKFSIFTKLEDYEYTRTGVTCTGVCGEADANEFVVYTTGYGNLGTVNVNADGEVETSGIALYLSETGDFNESNISITGLKHTVVLLTMGDVNTFNSVTTGEENFSYASVTGYLNNISITQSGTKGLVILDIAGNQNTATVTQSGGGALGHWTNLSVSGNLNTHTIAQSGTAADSVVDIKTTGGSNNFNINVNSR
jgi:hypothetical protein